MTHTDHPAREPHVGQLVDTEQVPPWLRQLTGNVTAVTDSVLGRGGDRTRWASMLRRDRRAASVLILFSGSWDADPDYPGGLPADAEVCLLYTSPSPRD